MGLDEANPRIQETNLAKPPAPGMRGARRLAEVLRGRIVTVDRGFRTLCVRFVNRLVDRHGVDMEGAGTRVLWRRRRRLGCCSARFSIIGRGLILDDADVYTSRDRTRLSP
jgi:hypothetical protein